MIKVSAQTFPTASRRKSEINIRVSGLYDNLHSFLRSIRIIIKCTVRTINILSKFKKNLNGFRNRSMLVFLMS